MGTEPGPSGRADNALNCETIFPVFLFHFSFCMCVHMCVVYVHALHYKQVPPHLDFLNMNPGHGTQVLVLLKRTTAPSVPSPQAQHARLAVHPSLKPSTLLLAPLEQPAGSSFLYIGRRASPRGRRGVPDSHIPRFHILYRTPALS